MVMNRNLVNNMTQTRFGNMEVTRESPSKVRSSGKMWVAECHCGIEIHIGRNDILAKITAATDTRCHNQQCKYNKVQRKKNRGCIPKDIAGQKFCILTAIRPTDKRYTSGSVIWECRCDCGNKVEVAYQHLYQSRKRSCGCIPQVAIPKIRNTKSDMLTAIKLTGKSDGRGRLWLVKCDCGNTLEMSKANFDRRFSCGCTRRNPPVEKTHAYNSWKAMRQGNRAGIGTPKKWDSYKAFLEDMGERPEGTRLTRADKSKPFSITNCSWN